MRLQGVSNKVASFFSVGGLGQVDEIQLQGENLTVIKVQSLQRCNPMKIHLR